MSVIKIEELNTISTVNDANVLPIVDSNNETKKVSITQLKTKITEDLVNLHFTIVQTLPTQDIQTNVIYLVPKNPSGTNDIYTEYAYINNAWEKLGETQIDLSDYVKNTDYATTTAGGVIIPARGMTLDNDGKTQAAIISYANYPSVTDATFISKGTLEYVIAGKGLNSTPKVIVITQSDYDNLQSYEDNTEYHIIES